MALGIEDGADDAVAVVVPRGNAVAEGVQVVFSKGRVSGPCSPQARAKLYALR